MIIQLPDTKLCFQPYIGPLDEAGQPTKFGVEALLEEPGLLNDLSDEARREVDLRTLKEACVQMSDWQGIHPGLRLSVNTWPHYYKQPDFANRVIACQKHSGLAPHLLTLELLEGEKVPICQPVPRENFHQLRDAGIRLVLDDVGTGFVSTAPRVRQLLRWLYESASYFTGIKLDLTIIQELQVERVRKRIIAFILLAEEYGLDVVAEGVETSDQAVQLRKLCPGILFQGHGLAPKMPPDKFERWVKKELFTIK